MTTNILRIRQLTTIYKTYINLEHVLKETNIYIHEISKIYTIIIFTVKYIMRLK